MSLSGGDIVDLAELLKGATSQGELDLFVLASTGDELFEDYLPPNTYALKPLIANLLRLLQKNGTLELFLAYFCKHKPGRDDVAQYIEGKLPGFSKHDEFLKYKVGLSAQKAGTINSAASTNALAPGFEKILRPIIPLLDIQLWLNRIVAIQRQICRIDADGVASGTGFLIGPDLVLTNCHVVSQDFKTCSPDISCRFDYIQLSSGEVETGMEVPLAQDGCLLMSAPSRSDAGGDGQLPTEDELDFALLRLARPVGADRLAGDQPRGWLKVPFSPILPQKDGSIFIVQHPEGGTMKLALDTNSVLGLNSNGTRLRYLTNTEPGSSGSPCLSIDWSLVALHHYGRRTSDAGGYNQGIPIGLIRKKIDREFSSLLAELSHAANAS
ncbi:serine protease [Mesorhizobium sp.]|uniref:trypsin-like serine peptidase n=1 Tax=Mesorhizobium sp. TaxID=1871066 RepID=UPI00121D94E9|nr:serine protease [Mesorhizobium sp.]TIL42777.1 MAG: trypsin-like peptidase domain-containing protein [Mesorhizobium sp.]